MAVLTAALLATTLAVPALQSAQSGLANHGGWIADIRNHLRNPIDYFSQRSPGARGAGQLTQSKHRMFKLPRNGVKPHEQVLSNVRYGSPVPPFVNDLVPQLGPSIFAAPPFEPSVPAVPSPPAPSIFPPTVVPVVPASPANTNPGGTPSGSTVPESSTWLMLIWGMALVGFGLRSQQRYRAKGTARIGFRAQI